MQVGSRARELACLLCRTLRRRLEQAEEEGRGLGWPRLELGMELAADVVRVVAQLKHFHALARCVAADELHAGRLQLLDVVNVYFVAVAVPLVERGGTVVEACGHALRGLEHGAARAEAHRAAHVRARDLGHEDDQLVRSVLVKLGRVRRRVAQHRARVLNHCHLEAEADAEERDLVLTRELGHRDLALNRPDAKATRNHDAVDAAQRLPCLVVSGVVDRLVLDVELGRVDPLDHELSLHREGGVRQRLGHREVRVRQVRVLTHHSDLHLH
mmetsp:Transcript_24339/g.53154  ORF Transcript_24339/g.53154 Transcript_24339/m.53154 type:complete len:271 (+) Transcript_24339:326-1138(+)